MQAVSGVVGAAASFFKKTSWTTLLVGALVLVGAVFAYQWWRGMKGGFTDASGAEGFKAGADTFTMYYAEWCPHCKAVKPQFSNFAAAGAKDVNGKPVFVRMVEEKEIDPKNAPKIDGYPTFLLEKADGSKVTYEGERTADGWMQFLKQNV